ncbi:thiamine phosphate synthase, partial [Neisseria meningitidis]|uniref:thiamine phosphate synthase n=1 Tax=Neisseria meningitidis TaxID=487 RepID=UPI000CC38CD5
LRASLPSTAAAGLRLVLSTHSVADLDRALSVHPSCIATGAICPTTTKQMPAAPQGLDKLREYVKQAGGTPVVAIGGIDLNNARA